jgi:hypothetical protein
MFTGNPELGKRMGLRAEKTHVFYNGPLECRLLRFRIEPGPFSWTGTRPTSAPGLAILERMADGGGAEGFINSLRKNLRHLGRWVEREGVRCYRLYDADLPEYAVAVDRYEQWLHVQEYAPPATIDPAKARERLEQVLTVLPAVLELPPENGLPQGPATAEREPTNIKNGPNRDASMRSAKDRRGFGSISPIIWTPACFSITALPGKSWANWRLETLFQPVRLHRHGHRLRRAGRRGQHHHRRSVVHLSGLGPAQSGIERPPWPSPHP